MKLEIEISTSIYNALLKNSKDYSFEILTLKQIKSLDRAIRKGKVISKKIIDEFR